MVRQILMLGLFAGFLGCAPIEESPPADTTERLRAIEYDKNLNNLRKNLYTLDGVASSTGSNLATLLAPAYSFSGSSACEIEIPQTGSAIVSSSHPLCLPDQKDISTKLNAISDEARILKNTLSQTLPDFETKEFKCLNDIKKCNDFGFGWLNCDLAMIACLVIGDS